MKRILFIVWAVVVWQVAGWTFAPQPSPPPKPPDIDPQTRPNEKYLAEGRNFQRQDGLRAIDVPRSNLCSEDGRKKFVSGLGYYYSHRHAQTTAYPQSYGKSGADYIARQWGTADDRRIDRLTKESYSNGYLKPDEFNADAREIILTIVKGERIIGKGCSG